MRAGGRGYTGTSAAWKTKAPRTREQAQLDNDEADWDGNEHADQLTQISGGKGIPQDFEQQLRSDDLRNHKGSLRGFARMLAAQRVVPYRRSPRKVGRPEKVAHRKRVVLARLAVEPKGT